MSLDSLSDGGGEIADPTTAAQAARPSSSSSFCSGIRGSRVVKEVLRKKLRIPRRLMEAMIEAVAARDATAAAAASAPVGEEEEPEAPIVAFVNSRSGGRHGPMVKERLQELIGDYQVFDLPTVNPSDFIRYGLACLEMLGSAGDSSAKTTREKLRIMVAGGDGTVGWLLGSLEELHLQKRDPVPPIGIIPLGTGNDLSRSFGWGGSFPFAWRSAVKNSLNRLATGPICHLDSWKIVIATPEGGSVELPLTMRYLENQYKDEDLLGELPKVVSFIGGVFYNYFSIGMDAQVAYGFHHLRDEKPGLAQGPIVNKMIYSGYGLAQGWFCTPCISDPSLSGLANVLRLYIKKASYSKWEHIDIPSSIRALVALNLHNYGSGRNPWGNLKADYLEKKGFVKAHADDGLLEIFGLKHGWHASFVMVELISAKHIAQAAAIRLKIKGGQWEHAYMQMDGEPWRHPVSSDYSTIVDITRLPFQSVLVSGE